MIWAPKNNTGNIPSSSSSYLWDHHLPTNHSIPGRIIGSTHYLYSCTRTDRYLVEKRKLKRSLSALLITAETIFVFLIPLGLTVWMVVNKLQDINLDPQTYIAPIQQVAEFIKEKTGYDVLGKDTLTFIVSILPRIGQIIMESISSLAINLFVMIFVFISCWSEEKKWKHTSTIFCHLTRPILKK